MQDQIKMATGQILADLLITNAQIVNVFTGEIELGCISIGQGKILGFTEIPAHKTIDAQGSFLLPGLIDAHIHLESSMLTPAKFADLVLPHGTTSLVADPHELANVLGVRGIEYVLACSEILPLNIFVTLPSCVPATPFELEIDPLLSQDLAPFINHPKVTGIAEIMNYPGVLMGDQQVLDKINLGQHKVLDGHAPGLLGQNLDAYLLTGISNTHECSTSEEMLANLRRGAYVLIRQGSAAKNLPELIKAVTPTNSRFCAFCCDDRHIKDIISDGHMDNHLRLAVQAGLDPITAITMCTLNAAQCFHLWTKGAIAPGYDADFILVDNLKDFKVQQVFVAGELIAKHGQLLQPCPEAEFDLSGNSIHLAPLSLQDFALSIPTKQARVIGLLAHSLVTENLICDLKTNEQGLFIAKDNPALTKIAVIERHKATGLIGLGLLANYNLKGGAIATTIAHDSHNIVVAGDSDSDMLLAVQELQKIGGGICLVSQGQVTSLALPIAGLITSADPKFVDEQLAILHHKAQALQINPEIDPFMTLSFMALPVIPHLKITPRGLFDVNSFSQVNLYEDLSR